MNWPPSKEAAEQLQPFLRVSKTFLRLPLALELKLSTRALRAGGRDVPLSLPSSIQSQLLSVQIQEPFPVLSFHLGEVHSKLFPWYRNSELSLKNSEILQFTPL